MLMIAVCLSAIPCPQYNQSLIYEISLSSYRDSFLSSQVFIAHKELLAPADLNKALFLELMQGAGQEFIRRQDRVISPGETVGKCSEKCT